MAGGASANLTGDKSTTLLCMRFRKNICAIYGAIQARDARACSGWMMIAA
jgi:hypothetical protein